MKNSQQKIFFDVSSLIDYVSEHSCYSGIQRVVAVLVSEFSKIVDPRLLYISFLGTDGRHKCVDFAKIGTDGILSPKLMASMFYKNIDNLKHPSLKGYHDQYLKYHFHKTKSELLYRLKPSGFLKSHSFDADRWEKGKHAKRSNVGSSAKLFENISEPGDHLILLDSTWQPKHTKVFIDAKNRGLNVHTMVHDLIPIKSPGSVESSEPFRKWILDSAKYTTRYLANSKFTKFDLREFVKSNGIHHDIGLVPLAQCGLPESKISYEYSESLHVKNYPKTSGVYDFLDEFIGIPSVTRGTTLSPFALCVGTIEARKNTWRIAMAWKKMIDRGICDIPKLVFAGRRGWLCEDLTDLMKGTGNIYGYAKIIEGPSDDELKFLYKKCKFTVNVSTYEGWGLPVGESLAYGKTSVVANATSLPEVGGDLVEYCDPHSIDSIHNAALRLISDPSRINELEEKIKNAHLRSWSDVAQNLLSEIYIPPK